MKLLSMRKICNGLELFDYTATQKQLFSSLGCLSAKLMFIVFFFIHLLFDVHNIKNKKFYILIEYSEVEITFLVKKN